MSDIKAHILPEKNARIGIINRGEPACRFIRSVKEYNNLNSCSLKSIAFYISKEADSLFVRNSDESYLLKDESTSLTGAGHYLDHDLLINALKNARCDAVWVGWGFVSEDAAFAEKIEKEGIVFLGPSSRAMALLGDKITAKDLAEKSDVPVLPWSGKPVGTLEEAEKISEKIGYPVIIKASNAGGGRGIRIVRTPDQLPSQYKSALEETIRITGNDILFIECFVEKGRHLEVQVISDYHGNINTLGVRDCSVQRNNQKIIEETPPPLISGDIIRKMEKASSRLMKISGYTGAGTVEYLYDLNRKQFYFMEVNTRLQVEHPITEILYGFDLVKGQIDVAMGKEVKVGSKKSAGSVIEVRLNAEDPSSNFSPSPGEVLLFVPPAGPGIRVDSGIEQNSSIPSDFDSMVAKVIAYGSDREETLARIRRAVAELKIKIRNGTSNKAFVLDLLNSPQIFKGGVHTGFVKEFIENSEKVNTAAEEEAAVLSSAVEIYLRQQRNELENFRNQVSRSGSPRMVSPSAGEKVDLVCRGCSYSFQVKNAGSSYYHINYLDKILVCRYRTKGEESFIEVNSRKYNMILTDRGDTIQCDVNGVSIPVTYQSGGIIKSRSPAVVLSVSTNPGDAVEKGDPLVVLEAMKMEMVVSAPASGTVGEIFVSEGEQVAAGQPLAVIEESGEKLDESSNKPLDFNSVLDNSGMKRSWFEREIYSFFLGFDNEKDASSVWEDFIKYSFSDEILKNRLPDIILNILNAYTGIEKLFVAGEVETEIFSRPVTYPEMLSHYFRRNTENEKGLPDEFLEAVNNASECYSRISGPDSEDSGFNFLNIYKSHKNKRSKDAILKMLFSDFDRFTFPEEKSSVLSGFLDEIIDLSSSSSVYDSAVSARYLFTDSKKLENVKKETLRQLESVIDRASASEKVTEKDLDFILDSGSYIIPDLISLSLSDDPGKRRHGLSFACLRFNRDRQVVSTGFKKQDNLEFFYAETSQEAVSFFTASEEENIPDKIDTCRLIKEKDRSRSPDVEIIFLVRCREPYKSSMFDDLLKKFSICSVSLTIGLYSDDGCSHYRTYEKSGNEWAEITLMKNFSPLQFRELKVYRFSDFKLENLYLNEGVFVFEACSKSNPEDIRLVSFVDVSELLPTLKADSRSHLRLLMFEALFNEAANAVRSLQARYKKRLLWNRIVVHNRTLLGIKFKELQEYGSRLMKQAGDIGLEKLTVLTRRKRWSENFARSVELDFIPVAGNQIVIRTRQPSEDALVSVDSYTAKVINSRHKKTVYPYEIITLLTGSASFGLGVSSGSFEEYDIEAEETSGSWEAVSVKDREPGLNSSNIVFGIIENRLSATGTSIRRVIILSDATRDMGSLAEDESKRVLAAVDLAEKENIPLEWIPVSSGARIDMKSGTENLDWTAAVLRRIIEFTQNGGEINIIVSATNVGAQSYWNAEATMLMHTKGLLIMTENASMLLTGKKALDFSGSVSGDTNIDIGGAEKIMAPNGQAQIRVPDLSDAFRVLFRHYRYTYISSDWDSPLPLKTEDSDDRDISDYPYSDAMGQGFVRIGDIFDPEKNPDRKKPFDMRQLMSSVIDTDGGHLERWQSMHDSETSIVWECQIGGIPAGMIGIESRTLSRIGEVPSDGPESWNGGTLYPMSSKKTARALNAFSGSVPAVILANLSGFDGSPESLRKLQLEYGAEIGRAVVNFKGPLIFIVTARYHGGAYVVFSKKLNPSLTAAAVEGSFASVIGGAPAAAVVFPRKVLKETYADERIKEVSAELEKNSITRAEFADIFKKVYNEKQRELGHEFDRIHSVERARKVGSIDDIVSPEGLRPYIIGKLKSDQSISIE